MLVPEELLDGGGCVHELISYASIVIDGALEIFCEAAKYGGGIFLCGGVACGLSALTLRKTTSAGVFFVAVSRE